MIRIACPRMAPPCAVVAEGADYHAALVVLAEHLQYDHGLRPMAALERALAAPR